MTILALNFCNIALALIGCSINYRTYPGVMFVTFVISLDHDESCSTRDLTMLHKSTKSSSVPNLGSSMSFITRFNLIHLFSHLAQFSWISWCASQNILTKYLVDFLMRLMLLSISTQMSCSLVSWPFCTTLIYSIISMTCCAFSYHLSISFHVASAIRVSSLSSTILVVNRCHSSVNLL
jgi:hypothetical protein